MTKFDRTKIEQLRINEVKKDRDYWLSKSVDERFEAAETLRQIAYGYDPINDRVQRILEVVKRK